MYLHLKIRNKNVYKETTDYTQSCSVAQYIVHNTDNVTGNILKFNCQLWKNEQV